MCACPIVNSHMGRFLFSSIISFAFFIEDFISFASKRFVACCQEFKIVFAEGLYVNLQMQLKQRRREQTLWNTCCVSSCVCHRIEPNLSKVI